MGGVRAPGSPGEAGAEPHSLLCKMGGAPLLTGPARGHQGDRAWAASLRRHPPLTVLAEGLLPWACRGGQHPKLETTPAESSVPLQAAPRPPAFRTHGAAEKVVLEQERVRSALGEP